MEQSPPIIFVLGRSGCGKGTQAKLLAEKLGVDYIGSGDMLRERQKRGDFTGKKIGETMDKTVSFVPTPVIFKLWLDRFEELKEKSGFRGFVVDGSPRKIREAELIDETLKWYEWGAHLGALLVDVSREECLRRLLKRARDDDTQALINNRFDSFEKEVLPVLDFYEKSGRLTRINGEQSVEAVHQDVMRAIT